MQPAEPYIHDALVFAVRCPCGHWTWRETPAIAGDGGVSYEEKKCPRCQSWYVILRRFHLEPNRVDARLLGIVRKTGRNLPAMLLALGKIEGLHAGEINNIARLASHLHAQDKAA